MHKEKIKGKKMKSLKAVLIAVSILTIMPVALQAAGWVAKIDDSFIITTDDFKNEFNYFAKSSGVSSETIDSFYSDKEEVESFLDTLINTKLIYLQAVEKGYLEKEAVKQGYEVLVENKLLEYYLLSILDIDKLSPSDYEAKQYFNDNEESIKQMAGGQEVSYEAVENDIKTMLVQENLMEEMKNILNATKEMYGIKVTKNPSSSVAVRIDYNGGQKQIKSDKLDEQVNALEEAGLVDSLLESGRIDSSDDLKEGILDSLINNKILSIRAEEDGFLRGSEAQAIRDLLKSKIVVQAYISDKIKSQIKEPSPEQIDKAFKQLDAQSGGRLTEKLNSLSGQKKIQAMMNINEQLKQTIVQQKYSYGYQYLIQKLKERHAIKKRPEAVLR